MSEAQQVDAPAVVRLPTAARRKVRQCASHGLRAAAIEAGQDVGAVIALPPEHWVAPWVRRRDAAEAETQAVYDAGGVTDGAPFTLAAAVFSALPEAEQQHALAHIRLMASRGSAGPKATLLFAERMVNALKVFRAADPDR